MPSVSAVLAPEPGFPYKDLLLDSAQHQQNQACGGKLRQPAEDDAHRAGKFCCAKKNREALAHPDALAAALRVFQVAPAAAGEYGAYYHPQQQNSNILKLGELREHNAILPGIAVPWMGPTTTLNGRADLLSFTVGPALLPIVYAFAANI